MDNTKKILSSNNTAEDCDTKMCSVNKSKTRSILELVFVVLKSVFLLPLK